MYKISKKKERLILDKWIENYGKKIEYVTHANVSDEETELDKEKFCKTAHIAFEGIHPFRDGNGRTGRLLMNFILHKNRFPMINIPNAKKTAYYECLQHAQLEGNLEPLIKYLFKILKEQNLRF